MTIRSQRLGLVTLLILLGAASTAADPPSSVDEAIHREIQRVEREIQIRWRQVQDHAVRQEERPGAAPAPPGLAKQVEDLHRELARLESMVLGQEGTEEWLEKLRSLDRVLGNLDRVVAGHRPPEPRDSLGAQVIQDPQTIGIAPTDSCAAAPTIGNGTFTGTTIGATNDGSATCGSSAFSPDVWLRYVSPLGGRVSVDTFSSGFDTVLSIHTACPDNGSIFQETCNDDALGLQSAVNTSTFTGETLWIRVSGFNSATGPFELHVGPGGVIEGTVTEESTGDPISTGQVEAYDRNGFFERAAALENDGKYSLGVLTADTYRVVTDTSSGVVDEVFDDRPCLVAPDLFCDFQAAEPVAVNSLEATSGVDFSLGPGAAIAGTVTDRGNGNPVEGVRVEARIGRFELVAFDFTDAQGRYRIEGLVDAAFSLTAEDFDLLDELYDDVPCEGGLPFGCTLDEGTLVQIVSGQDAVGIDFALDRRSTISGQVSGDGEPLAGARVNLFTGSFFASSVLTDGAGRYEFTGLFPGTYFVGTDVSGFLDEVYDRLPCEDECNESLGTPLEIAAGIDLTAIDFDLQRAGGIAGKVIEAASGARIGGAEIEIWDAEGQFVERQASDLAGTYFGDDLSPGTYFLTAGNRFFGGTLVDQLYQGIDCPGGPPAGCDPTAGTPVTVSPGATTTGIDFAMSLRGFITGRVTLRTTGQPVRFRFLQVWNEDGFVDSDSSDSLGRYSFSGLLPGTYFVSTDLFEPFVNEVYDDILCNPTCDATKGTPIEIGFGDVIQGIDFEIERLQAGLVGTVLDEATGLPLVQTPIQIWDPSGFPVLRVTTRRDGLWLADLPPGTYFVSTDAEDIANQVYAEVECDGACNPLEGTPILVQDFDSIVRGIDFRLDALPIFANGFESGDFSSWSNAISVLP